MSSRCASNSVRRREDALVGGFTLAQASMRRCSRPSAEWELIEQLHIAEFTLVPDVPRCPERYAGDPDWEPQSGDDGQLPTVSIL